MAFLTVKTLHNPVISYFLLYNGRKGRKLLNTSLEIRKPLVFVSYVKDTQLLLEHVVTCLIVGDG